MKKNSGRLLKPFSLLFVVLFMTASMPCGAVHAATPKRSEWVAKSLAAYRARNFGEAIKYAVQAIQQDPNDPEAYNARGLARYGQDQKDLTKLSLEDFDKAIQLKPDFPEAYMNRGNAKGDLGQYDSDIEDQNFALKLLPNSVLAYHNRGAAYYSKKSYDKAIADFSRSLELKPDDTEVILRRGNAYYWSGDLDRAMQDYEKGLKLDPKDGNFYKGRAKVYFKKGEIDRALEEANRALAIKPLAGAFNVRGDIYRGKGDLDRAIKDYDESIKIAPEQVNMDAYFGRGIAYKAKGDTKRDAEDLKKAVALNPDNATFKKELAALESGSPAGTPEKETSVVLGSSGGVTVTAPAGLVDNVQSLKINKVPDLPPAPFKGLREVASFDVSVGEQRDLKKPLKVEVAYDPSKVKSSNPPDAGVVAAQWDATQKKWQTVPSQVDTQRKVAIVSMEHLAPVVLFSEDETSRGANPPASLFPGADFSSSEVTEHFKVFYDKTKQAAIGPNNTPKVMQDPAKFAKEVGTYLEHAWDKYHNDGYPRPSEEGWAAWETTKSPTYSPVPVFILRPPRTDVFIDPACIESNTGSLSGIITLKFDYESQDEVRHDAAHEVFHTFQQRNFSRLSSLAQMGYVARHWWMEATADYVGDKIAWDGIGTMAKPNLEYFKIPMNTADAVHDYATSRFIDFLVTQKGVVFKDLWDASVANSSDNMVEFLETYLLRVTSTTLHDLYKEFAAYVLFDASGPLEMGNNRNLSGVIVMTGPYKGQQTGGLVEVDTPPLLAADKREISYKFSLIGGCTAKLWAFRAPSKDAKSPRTLKIATGSDPAAADVDANVYVLKNNERPKGGVAAHPELFKGTLNATKKSMILNLAQDEVAYVLAVNTGKGGRSLIVNAGEVPLAIEPPTASVIAGKTFNFSTPGCTEKVLWSVPGEGGGTISAAGVYTAPGKAGTYQVEVALAGDPATTASAMVTVTEAAQSEELKTVKISDSEEVTGYFQGDKLIKRHGMTRLSQSDGTFVEAEYQDGKEVHAKIFNQENRHLIVEKWYRGEDEFEYQETTYSWDGRPEFEKRRLDKNSKWQMKVSTGEWIDQ